MAIIKNHGLHKTPLYDAEITPDLAQPSQHIKAKCTWWIEDRNGYTKITFNLVKLYNMYSVAVK